MADAPPVQRTDPESGGPPSQSYWALVWGQFRKNRLALISTATIFLVFGLAAWAPLLANGKPFVWIEDGTASYPLLQYLVAPTEKMREEYLFNYFFFLTLTLPLVGGPMWWYARRRGLSAKVLDRRRTTAFAIAAALAGLPFIAPGTYERPATKEELKIDPQRKTVREFHLLRRWTLDKRDYFGALDDLKPERGDYAIFPPIAQDPLTPTREFLHPPSSYVRVEGRTWRWFADAAILAPRSQAEGLTEKLPSSMSARDICIPALVTGVEENRMRIQGSEGLVLAVRPGLLSSVSLHTESWIFGTLRYRPDRMGFQLEAHDVRPAPVRHHRFSHLLGTDREGRDVLARMLHGTRITMSVGFVAEGIAVLIGILIGGLAGYYRGWVDIAISRFIELVICFPAFFLIITIIAFIEDRSIFHIMLVIGLTSWPGIARLIRGEFLKLADQDFVHAARALGCGGSRIMFRHILPNAMGPVFVSAAFGVAGAILTESALSYLGFGAPPPSPTWGEMISQGKTHIDEAWWLLFFPGLLIFVSVTIYNLAGDGLRDAMDPKLRK